jgi:hypothetical protein
VSRSEGGLGTAELARFFGKAWQLRFAGILIAATTFLVVAGTSAADSLQLSAEQRARSALGTADARIQLPGSAPIGSDPRGLYRALTNGVSAAGGRDVSVEYVASGLRPDHAASKSVIYEEFPSQAHAEGQFSLQSGAWPTRANEGMISQSLATRWPIGSAVGFFNGKLRVKIVGIVVNRFSTDADEIVGGPGTWESLSTIPKIDAARLDEAAGLVVRWSGGLPPLAMASVVSRLVDADPVAKAAATLNGGVVVQTRLSIEQAAPAPNVPLTAVGIVGPLAAGLLAGLFAGAFTRRTRDVMWEIGISYRQTRGAALVAIGVVSLSGALAGVLLGAGLGLVIRPLLEHIATQELSPWVVDLAWFGAIPIAVVGAILGVMLVRAKARSSATQIKAAREASQSGAIVRVCAGVVIGAFGVFLGTGTSDLTQMSLAALLIAFAIVVVFAPIVLNIVGRQKPKSFAMRLAVRTVRSDRRQVRTVVIAIAGLQILAFTLSILLTSSIAAVNNNVESAVPPGEIVFAPQIASRHDVDVVRRAFESSLGLTNPVIEHTVAMGNNREDGPTIVVDSPADLEHLISRALSKSETAVLKNVGTLVTRRIETGSVAFPRIPGFAGASLPAAPLNRIDPSFLNVDGFILATTAAKLHLPSVNETYVYTGTTSTQRQRVEAVTAALSLNQGWVRVYRAPDQLTAPLRISAIVVALALIAAIVMLFSSLAQAKAVRPQISGLRALGVGSAFIARAIAARSAITFLISTAFGIVASSISVGIALSLANLTIGVAIPGLPITLMVFALAIFTAIVSAVATRRISKVEWQDA